MSRIGKNPVPFSSETTVSVADGVVTVKGKLGELIQKFDSSISISVNENEVGLTRTSDDKQVRSYHGLYRSLIANMVEGVEKGYEKKLELVGVGYRAVNQGQKLDLALGFSHNILLDIAPEVKVETISEKGNHPVIVLTSIDKQLIGAVAAKIRSFRRPEPYKGKGIKYMGEYIRRKAGKTAAS